MCESPPWPSYAGEMGERIRKHDWAATPLGSIESWPQSLRTLVDLMLASRQPVYIAWGPDLTSLYNDGFASILGEPAPGGLGKPYPDIWGGYRTIVDAAMAGEAQHIVGQPIPFTGRPNDPMRLFTLSWTPLRNESGAVSGLYCALNETTEDAHDREPWREREERYRSLVSHSSEGIWLLEFDPPLDTTLPADDQIELAYRNGRFTECNDAMARMYGLACAEDLIGKTLEFPMPVADPATKAFLINVIQSRYNLTDVESIEYDADGNRRHFANSMIGVVESGKLRRLWGIQREITDRKRAEEQRTLLINELNHRVKNTLATVQSIANQTLRNAQTIAEAREAFESRLIALSRAHDVLTRESWEGADLYDIAAQAVAPYANRGEVRFHLLGMRVRVPPRMALSLAMALQELATNAVKYGALSCETGEIRIAWEVEQGEPARLRLRWEESGGPPVRAPTRRGFGSQLVERGLARDLNGTARIAFPPTGVVCTVEAPLA